MCGYCGIGGIGTGGCTRGTLQFDVDWCRKSKHNYASQPAKCGHMANYLAALDGWSPSRGDECYAVVTALGFWDAVAGGR